jgi:hypothetical protein
VQSGFHSRLVGLLGGTFAGPSLEQQSGNHCGLEENDGQGADKL